MPAPELDLQAAPRIHVVGIGGAGMSAIASVLAARGHEVSGSDLKARGLDRLAAENIAVHVGHDAALVSGVDLVAVSTAIPERNEEVAEARRLGIRVASRAEVLGALTAGQRTIAIAGTHGKTTTSSMLALMLRESGLDPSYIIGGELNETGTGAAWTGGSWFVVEADESDGTFLRLSREVAVVTSVEPDHLGHYGSFDALVAANSEFLAGAERRIVCVDEPVAASLAERHGATTYGTADRADYRITDVSSSRSETSFRVDGPTGDLGRFVLPVPGLYNVRNAVAGLATALAVGADAEAARRALARFAGVARRYQFRGETAGVSFVDDYAHLPSEVAAALAATQSGGWNRVVCVFQPHRYTRTRDLWQAFADSFVDADLVVVTDVYPAGERAVPGVTGKLVVDAVLDAHPWSRVAYLPRRRDVVAYLVGELQSGDVCLTLGAGDLTLLADELIPSLEAAAA